MLSSEKKGGSSVEGIFREPEIVGVISGLSTAKAEIRSRPSHTFLYKLDGESLYFLRGKEVRLTPGTLLYIPEGETYSFRKISEGDSRYCLINFHARTETPPEPRLYTFPAGENIAHLLGQMERNFRFAGEAGRLECLSLFYHLLAVLVRSEELPYTTRQQKERIDLAMDFLEQRLFDRDLRVADLARVSGLSAPAFRQIFISRFGVTPKKYILQQRMLGAKLILESGEYDDITRVAAAVGFEDPLYFSRCFRAFYGVPPTRF